MMIPPLFTHKKKHTDASQLDMIGTERDFGEVRDTDEGRLKNGNEKKS